MKLSALLSILIRTVLLSVCISGCAQYVEKETPATVAPPPSTGAQPIPGYDQGKAGAPAGASQAAPAASSISPYTGRPLSGAVQPLTEEVYAASIARFEKAYPDANSPRIAIYFNKALSDEVREWITPSRTVVAGKGEKVSVGGGPTVVTTEGAVVQTDTGTKAEGSADTERGVVSYTQEHAEEAHRKAPEETWMWLFEDNFLQPFLKAGAKTVDRATILRLVAAGSGKQGDAYSPEAVKKIEMDALAGHADILVELLVTRDHASPSGYAFRATAKEVKTGLIVGSVTKSGRDYRYEKSYEVFTSPSGYEIRKGSVALILENISQELAIDLMNSMANSWQKRPVKSGNTSPELVK